MVEVVEVRELEWVVGIVKEEFVCWSLALVVGELVDLG